MLKRLIAKTDIAPTYTSAIQRLIEMRDEPGYISGFMTRIHIDEDSYTVTGLYDHGKAHINKDRNQKEVFILEEPIHTFHIHIWPDNTWCYSEEYNEYDYSYKSDDFCIKKFGGEWTYDEIDNHVTELNKGGYEKFLVTDTKPHQLYKTDDPDLPRSICDPNGEVVLAYCKICGGAEATLPTNCPGRQLTEEEENKISAGELDF